MSPLPLLALLSSARAGDSADVSAGGLAQDAPYACVADWTGPTEDCEWTGTVHVAASGRNEAQARRSGLRRLEVALGSWTQAAMLDARDSAFASRVQSLRACTRRVEEQATVTCFPQPLLAGERLCYADLPDDPCWAATIQTFSGTGWQAQEEARDALCSAVTDAFREAQADTPRAAGEALRCRARCLESVRVRCR